MKVFLNEIDLARLLVGVRLIREAFPDVEAHIQTNAASGDCTVVLTYAGGESAARMTLDALALEGFLGQLAFTWEAFVGRYEAKFGIDPDTGEPVVVLSEINDDDEESHLGGQLS